MTKFKITLGSYQVEGKWIPQGMLFINHDDKTQEDIKLIDNMSDKVFDTQQEADDYVNIIAKRTRPSLFSDKN